MNWIKFYLLCIGLSYLSQVIFGTKNKDYKEKMTIKKAISIIKDSIIFNFIAWLCLQYSFKEAVNLIKNYFWLQQIDLKDRPKSVTTNILGLIRTSNSALL